jgi:CRP-like cAMP-binding protein
MIEITAASPQAVTRAALEASAFGALTPRQLDDIAGLSDLRRFEAGTNLCLQHDFSQEVFVLAAGSVGVMVDGIEVARRGPGDLVGDWALFGNGHRTASLRALTAVDVVVVDPRELDLLLAAVPALADDLGPHPLRISR